jgi:hypothetical protein
VEDALEEGEGEAVVDERLLHALLHIGHHRALTRRQRLAHTRLTLGIRARKMTR